MTLSCLDEMQGTAHCVAVGQKGGHKGAGLGVNYLERLGASREPRSIHLKGGEPRRGDGGSAGGGRSDRGGRRL